MRKNIVFVIILSLLAYSSQSQLVTFTFSGTGTCPTQGNSVISPSNTTVSSFGRVGLSCVATDNYFNSSSFTSSTSIDMSQYIEVSITPSSGYMLNLTSINFNDMRSSTGPSSSRIAHNGAGDFNANFYDFVAPISSTNAGIVGWTFNTPIVTASTVIFRIYGWNATSSSGTMRIGNFAINGSVITNNVLSFDYINKRVGIGTAIPTTKLQVAGKTTTDSLMVSTNINFPSFPYVSGSTSPPTSSGLVNFGNENVFMLRSDKTFATGAGNNNANGYTNIFLGRGFPSSINQITNGGGNIAIGDAFYNNALSYPNNPSFGKLTNGFINTMIGQGAYSQLTSGYFNTAVGYGNLFSLTEGFANTALGLWSLNNTTSGWGNLGLGVYSLKNNSVGNINVAVGYGALSSNDSGSYNSALGASCLYYLHGNSQYNTALGSYGVLQNLDNGNFNTAVGGRDAGYNIISGNNNTFLGAYSGTGVTSTVLNNSTAIGYQSAVKTDNTIILGNNAIVGVAFGNGLSTANAMLEVQNNNFNPTLVNFENSQGKKLFSLDSSGQLFVNGNINTKKIKVSQSGWADYVFSKEYQLRPLSQVEKYIQEKKHLPDIPSAKNIEKNGLDIAETEKLLLQKIEELTLYLIDVKKENENLKKRLENLENKK